MVFLEIKALGYSKVKSRKTAGYLKGIPKANKPDSGFGIFRTVMDLNIFFILFFGTRPGKLLESRLTEVSCPYCEKEGFLTARVQARFVHLFWIPVYRLSPDVLIRCEHCKKAYQGNECTPHMQEALRKLESA